LTCDVCLLQVGTFDPYSDDPRLAIQKLKLCPLSETLVLGGTAGQIIVLNFERDQREQEVKVRFRQWLG
jgi:lethal(2) giant larvae protein